MTENLPPHPTGSSYVSDELLSAYLDDAVTEEERVFVEAALRSDTQTLWRLDSLRQTVSLLHTLPQVKLPRSYALATLLAAEQSAAAGLPGGATVAVPPIAPRPATSKPARTVAPAPRRGFWDTLGAFFGGGNLALRNSAAAAFALFVFLMVGSQAVGTPRATTYSAAPVALESPLQGMAADAAAAQPAPAMTRTVAKQNGAVAQPSALPAPAEAQAAVAVQPAAAADAASAAPAAMMAAEAPAPPQTTQAAPLAASAAAEVAMPAMAAPAQAAAGETAGAAAALAAPMPRGLGGDGMGGGAAEQPLSAAGAPSGEDATGLDVAMAESAAGVAAAAPAAAAPVAGAPAASARNAAPADAAAPAAAAPAAATVAPTAAALATVQPTAAPPTVAPPTVAPATAAPPTVAPAASAVAAQPSVSQLAYGVSWLTLGAWALGALALVLALLWLISRRAVQG